MKRAVVRSVAEAGVASERHMQLTTQQRAQRSDSFRRGLPRRRLGASDGDKTYRCDVLVDVGTGRSWLRQHDRTG